MADLSQLESIIDDLRSEVSELRNLLNAMAKCLEIEKDKGSVGYKFIKKNG